MTHHTMAYALARLPLGVSFLGHGLVRLPKLVTFAEGMANTFDGSWLPDNLVFTFGLILPVLELLLGILLVIGPWMRQVCMAGVFFMCVLIAGSSILENWEAVAIQLFYGLYFSVLFLFARYSGYSFETKSNTTT